MIISNNWVQNMGNNLVKTKTNNQYINDYLKPINANCNPGSLSDVPINNYSDEIYSCVDNCSNRIGGKYYYNLVYSKQTNYIPDSSTILTYNKAKNGILSKTGWSAPWPSYTAIYNCINNKSFKDVIITRADEQSDITNTRCSQVYLNNYIKILKSRT